MRIIGKTTDGLYVVSEIAALYFQEGIPPSIIFDGCKRLNLQPSFQHFYQELKNNGMSHSRIIHLLNEHLFESYGKEYRDHIITILESNGSPKTK